MSYDALRKGRVSLPGYAYFITTVTHNRSPFFRDLWLARLVIQEMHQIEREGHVKSLAWVLMPDHLHWLLQLGEHALLPEVMKRFKARSARAVNNRLGRSGSLWQRAFHDRALRENEDVQGTARYIVANPLRAGLVKHIGDYPFWDAVWL